MSMDFFSLRSGLSLPRERRRAREGDVLGENTVGAEKLNPVTKPGGSQWKSFLSTFPLFLFRDDPMREEKCCSLDNR